MQNILAIAIYWRLYWKLNCVILVDELCLTIKQINLHHYTLAIMAYSNLILLISVHTHHNCLLRGLFHNKQATEFPASRVMGYIHYQTYSDRASLL